MLVELHARSAPRLSLSLADRMELCMCSAFVCSSRRSGISWARLRQQASRVNFAHNAARELGFISFFCMCVERRYGGVKRGSFQHIHTTSRECRRWITYSRTWRRRFETTTTTARLPRCCYPRPFLQKIQVLHVDPASWKAYKESVSKFVETDSTGCFKTQTPARPPLAVDRNKGLVVVRLLPCLLWNVFDSFDSCV